jgi:hypothetical protein
VIESEDQTIAVLDQALWKKQAAGQRTNQKPQSNVTDAPAQAQSRLAIAKMPSATPKVRSPDLGGIHKSDEQKADLNLGIGQAQKGRQIGNGKNQTEGI